MTDIDSQHLLSRQISYTLSIYEPNTTFVMAILLLIPINRLILNIWIWLTKHVFQREGKKRHMRTSIGIGGLTAASLVAYPYLLEVFHLSWADYIDHSLIGSPTILFPLIAYSLAIILVANLISRSHLLSKKLLRQTLAWIILFVIGYVFLGALAIAPLAIYYLIVAASEEGLKYLSSIQLAKTRQFTASDYLLFAILIALGYAFIENIVYILQGTELMSNFFSQVQQGGDILLSRGLVGFLMHILFTGSIALISLHGEKNTKKKLISRSIAILVGILLHLGYNLSIAYGIKWGFVVYIVGGYLFMTYLFYRSDSLYIE